MTPETITIYSAKDSPRLRYVLDWLFTEQLNIAYRLTNDRLEAALAAYCIAYGGLSDHISVESTDLLFEEDIKEHPVVCEAWRNLSTFYYNPQSQSTIPFDLFAGIFYLLTRYEEYFRFEGDKHGRYPYKQSILSKNGVLERPVLDEWVSYFRKLLEEQWQVFIPVKQFRFQPTYDIDIAWSFLHKGFKRLLGASLSDLAKADFSSFTTRLKTIQGKAKDPYDAYEWMSTLHRQYKLHPHYFILAALQSGPFDKNIHPAHPQMKTLIKELRKQGLIGIHPSYSTNRFAEKLLAEKRVLEQTLEESIKHSRQHFIRLFLPSTYRALLAAGIDEDYSMGYSTSFGFRAGTSHSFFWFDLERGVTTALRIHPFCFMDTTAHFDLGLDVVEAYSRLRQMKNYLLACNGTLTTIFHNFSLGTAPEWKGWKEAYEAFISELPE